MRTLAVALALGMACHAMSRADNPVTNGGFETLTASYFPTDWSPVGPGVEVTTEARSGRYALRIHRAAQKPMPPETGLNRVWSPNSGQGAMLAETKGILRAWIRVRSAAPDATIALVVIPMGTSGVEDTGEMRAMRVVPNEFAGDGVWHELRLAYDYSAGKAVRWVHVGMRLMGGPADILLDDVELIEGPAAILQVEKVHVYPDRSDPGSLAMLTATVVNDGTAAADPISITLHLPEGLSADGPTGTIELPPGDGRSLRWSLRGDLRPGRIVIRAVSGTDTAERAIHIKPRLELLSALARPGIVSPKGSTRISLTLWNRGNAISPPTSVVLASYGGLRLAAGSVAFPEILPGRRVVREVVAYAPSAAGTPCGVDCSLSGADAGAPMFRVALEVTDAVRARAQTLVQGIVARQGSDRTMADILDPTGRKPIARMPHLGRITLRLPNGQAETLTARYGAPVRTGNGAVLRSVQRDRSGAKWTFTATVKRLNQQAAEMSVSVACDRSRRVALFEGPMLLVSEGVSGATRSEAIFPGLEWLVDDEVSSSDLDIIASHPDRPRYAPHPNKVTIPAMSVSGGFGTAALLWNVDQKWDGVHDRPQPVFASPDRIGGLAAHRLGLIAPSPVSLTQPIKDGVPLEAHYTRSAAVADPSRDIVLPAGRGLRLSAIVYTGPNGSTALDGIEQWFAWFKPAAPAPAPRGSDLAQVSWSMEAYLRSLWDTPETGWFAYLLGPAIWRHPSPNPSYAYDLLQATRMIPEDPKRDQWEARLKAAGFGVPDSAGSSGRVASADDLQFSEGDPLAVLNQHAMGALELINTQAPDGSYSFDADHRDTGVFTGYDYHELGEPGSVEIGLIAGKASRLLQIARITGDRSFYNAGVRALHRMEQFRVPRAAQVWEVPVHTPDILAAADAVDAYLEAYWYSGQSRWLDRAKLWARRGLPFIYVWNAPGKLWMRYGSIPVFGATQMRGSWFGNLVQWNGLRYAFALLKLHSHDPATRYGGLSWRDIAVGITRSAMHQQSEKPELLALWPDSLHTITDARSAWEFAPRQILKNVTWWLGRYEMPLTRRVPTAAGPIVRVSAIGRLEDVRLVGDTLTLRVVHPPRGRGNVLVAGITEPRDVRIGDAAVPRAPRTITAGMACWRYDPRLRAVAVHVPGDGASTVRLSGIRPAEPDLSISRADRLAFEFDTGFDGWTAQNDIAELEVRDGALHGRSSGGDPFLVRPNCHLDGNSIREVVLRIRASAHGGGQFYWTTAASPVYDERKVLTFSFPPDNAWHEVVLAVRDHPHWHGNTVTGIRIDPVNAADVDFAVDWVRAR